MSHHVEVSYAHFEREFLRLAFTTEIELSPAALAFMVDVPIKVATAHMNTLVANGILELDRDDDGRLIYNMPSRPPAPLQRSSGSSPRRTRTTTQERQADASSFPSALTTHSFVSEGPPTAIVVRRNHSLAQYHSQASHGQAVAGLCLNAAVCPGIGSIVGGRTSTGIAQLSLFLAGVSLAIFGLGLPLMLIAWVWAIASSADQLNKTSPHPLSDR